MERSADRVRGISRALKRFATLTTAILLALVVNPGVSFAHHLDFVAAGNNVGYIWTSGSGALHYSQTSWNGNGNPDFIDAYVQADTPMNNDRCVHAVADWSTADSGHFDARLIKVCKAGGYKDNNFATETQFHSQLLQGLQRLGTCFWNQDTDANIGCEDHPHLNLGAEGTPGGVNNCAVRMWIRYQNGDVGYWSAGNPLLDGEDGNGCD